MTALSSDSTSTVPRLAALRGPIGEVAVAATGLAVLAVIVFLPFVRHGGFVSDDWARAELLHSRGLGGAIHDLLHRNVHRPLLPFYFGVVGDVVGLHQRVDVALTVLEHLAVSVAAFAVARRLRLDLLSAGAIAALVLVYPFFDAISFWQTGGEIDFAVLCWLLGALAAFHGLSSGRARPWAWHALAVVLYLASIALYEIALVAILVTGASYLLLAPRAVALRRWAVDVGAAALLFVLFTSQKVHLLAGHDVHSVRGVGGTLHHVKLIADQGISLTAVSLVPFGAPGRWAVVVGVLLVLAVAGAVAWRSPDPALRGTLRGALLLSGAGAVLAIAGWAVLAPSDDYYSPLQAGVGNRINAVAGLGLVVLVVGCARAGAALAFAGVPRDRKVGSALVMAALLVGVGGGYLHHLVVDRRAYDYSGVEANAVATTLHQSIPPPPADAALLVTGFPLTAAPGIPVFEAAWDLQGAVERGWDDPTLDALPIVPEQVTCTAQGAVVTGVTGWTAAPIAYRRLIWVDVATRSGGPIPSRVACRAAVAR